MNILDRIDNYLNENKIPKDVKESLKWLEKYGEEQDISPLDNWKSGVKEPTYKTREHIKNISSAYMNNEITKQDIPKKLWKWFKGRLKDF